MTIGEAGPDGFVSPVSVWEIELKRNLGKLAGDWDVVERCRDAGFGELSIHHGHARLAGALPLHHRDPIDRMLVAQAQIEGLTVVTSDRRIARYQVAILSAS